MTNTSEAKPMIHVRIPDRARAALGHLAIDEKSSVAKLVEEAVEMLLAARKAGTQ